MVNEESWQPFMDARIELHGIIVDPDTSVNDPDARIEMSLEDKGTFRLPQDCMRVLKE